ncbi:MAG: hypothetical protein AAF998_01540 [Bacteroidota bacterium]
MQLPRTSRSYWYEAGILFLAQFVLLLLTTPLYEIDTNSFIAGGFSWDIYHNPLLNLVIAACRTLWPNVWFILAVQLAVYALCATLLIHELFRDHRRFRYPALALAAFEPLSLFYHFSLLSESLFTSLTLLSVALLIRCLRQPNRRSALLFGLAMGLTFLSKLSSMTHLPLFGLLLFAPLPWGRRMLNLGASLLPFTVCYLFVFIGQGIINEGDLYTVEGRVRWDFSSSMYDPNAIDGPEFRRYVDPYIIRDGQLVANRELRRELSYLGYKDCVADYEAQGYSVNRGINRCDSIFGAVAAQLMEQHFWAAERQFIHDNVYFLHHLSYIDYRFTPGLHYYHPPAEYAYIDSLMRTTFDYDLSTRRDRIPALWTSLEFGNRYLPAWWYLWWVALLGAAVLYLRNRHRRALLVLGTLTAIPLIFHLVYISYRARFFAPYLVLVGLLVLHEIQILLSPKAR